MSITTRIVSVLIKTDKEPTHEKSHPDARQCPLETQPDP